MDISVVPVWTRWVVRLALGTRGAVTSSPTPGPAQAAVPRPHERTLLTSLSHQCASLDCVLSPLPHLIYSFTGLHLSGKPSSCTRAEKCAYRKHVVRP